MEVAVTAAQGSAEVVVDSEGVTAVEATEAEVPVVAEEVAPVGEDGQAEA